MQWIRLVLLLFELRNVLKHLWGLFKHLRSLLKDIWRILLRKPPTNHLPTHRPVRRGVQTRTKERPVIYIIAVIVALVGGYALSGLSYWLELEYAAGSGLLPLYIIAIFAAICAWWAVRLSNKTRKALREQNMRVDPLPTAPQPVQPPEQVGPAPHRGGIGGPRRGGLGDSDDPNA